MNPYLYGLLVIVTTSLMGSSFTVGKLGLAYISPLLLAGIRFSLAGAIMALFVLRKPHPKAVADWGRMFVIGFVQTAGVMGCIFLSLRTITASESSILTFINPLLVVIWGTAFLGSKYKAAQWLGVVIGAMGVAITLGFHMQLKAGTLLGLGSAFFFSMATILVKIWGGRFNVWVLSAYQMLFGGLLLLLMSPILETPKFVLTVASIGILIWLAVMASIVQFAVWYYLLDRGDPGRTSAFLFLAPFFGVLSGWAILGEVIEWYVYLGGMFIFMGIFMVNWRSGRGSRGEMKRKEWR